MGSNPIPSTFTFTDYLLFLIKYCKCLYVSLLLWISKEEYIFRKNNDVKAIWQGKHHKEESKNKVREKMTPKDSKNKRIWVYKENKVKYLLKTKLDEYLNNGWKLGRVGYKPRKNSQGKLI